MQQPRRPPRTIKAVEPPEVKHRPRHRRKKTPILIYVMGDEPNIWHLASKEQRSAVLGIKPSEKHQCCPVEGVGENLSHPTHYANRTYVQSKEEGALKRIWRAGRRPPTADGHCGAVRWNAGLLAQQAATQAALPEENK